MSLNRLLCFFLSIHVFSAFDVKTMCLAPTDGLHLFFEKHTLNYNVVNEFEGRSVLGEGTFGQVRPVKFPSRYNYGPVAAKRIKIKKYLESGGDNLVNKKIGKELEIGIILCFGDVGPRVIGCAYADSFVYIVQQRLYGTLEDLTVQTAVKAKDSYIQISMWAEVFCRLHYMWDLGYVHQDIKPANLMLSQDGKKIYIIDFGLVQELENELNTGSGTPWYKSFDKYYNQDLTTSSDIYAMALSIAVFYSSTGKVFSYAQGSDKGQGLPDACFSDTNFRICLQHIVANVGEALYEAGFGPLTLPFNDKTINFTTLLYLSANYYAKPFGEDLFFQLLGSLLNKEYNKWLKTNPGQPAHNGHELVYQILQDKEHKFDVQAAIEMGMELEEQESILKAEKLAAYKKLILAQKRKDQEERERRERERQERLENERKVREAHERRIREAMLAAQKKKEEEDEAKRQAYEQYRLEQAKSLAKIKSQAQLHNALLKEKKSQAHLLMSPSSQNLHLSPSQAKLKQLMELDAQREDAHLISTPSYYMLKKQYQIDETLNRDAGLKLPQLKGSPSQAKLYSPQSPGQMIKQSPSSKVLGDMQKGLVLLKSKKHLGGFQPPVDVIAEHEEEYHLPYIGGRIPDRIIERKPVDYGAGMANRKPPVYDVNDEDEPNKAYGIRLIEDPLPGKAHYYNDQGRIKRTREVNDNEVLINRRFKVAKDSVELYKHKENPEARQKIYNKINKAAGYGVLQAQDQNFLDRVKSKKQFI